MIVVMDIGSAEGRCLDADLELVRFGRGKRTIYLLSVSGGSLTHEAMEVQMERLDSNANRG